MHYNKNICKKMICKKHHMIFRPYIVNLLPCIARVCRREEEAVQETLSSAMPKLCSALMPFANDTEVKVVVEFKLKFFT